MNNRTMRDLRKSYEEIPVPAELEERVRGSIERAKRESKKENRVIMQIRRIAAGAGATAAAFLIGVTALANSGASIAHAMEQLPMLGAITRVVTFRTYDDTEGGASAHIEVPSVEGADEVNNAIEEYTDTIMEQYKKDAAETGDEGHYELNLTYQTVTDNDEVFALRFDQTLVMASGNESVRIYDVDKATGKILSLSDLFQEGSDYRGRLVENIQSQMKEQMAEDESVTYWLDSEVGEWNFTELPENTAFYLNEKGELVVVFNAGDVAPMYMGVCEFTIPSEAIRDIANPDYLK